jgi:hypothetical protein
MAFVIRISHDMYMMNHASNATGAGGVLAHGPARAPRPTFVTWRGQRLLADVLVQLGSARRSTHRRASPVVGWKAKQTGVADCSAGWVRYSSTSRRKERQRR